MRFPVGDWQFWAASAIIVLVIVRAIWVNVRKRKGARGITAALTIEGEPAKGHAKSTPP